MDIQARMTTDDLLRKESLTGMLPARSKQLLRYAKKRGKNTTPSRTLVALRITGPIAKKWLAWLGILELQGG